MKIKFDHVGIVVKDIGKVAKFYKEALGCKAGKIYQVDVPGYKLKYALLPIGEDYVELLEPETGPWIKRLEERGEGSLWELCFEVDDIEAFYDKMKKRGIILTDRFDQPLIEKKYVEVPTGSRFAYMPRDKTYGTWVEILERRGEDKPQK
jgi:methylmalonyl-CoA/ethylmalonyl-CoA epimerase